MTALLAYLLGLFSGTGFFPVLRDPPAFERVELPIARGATITPPPANPQPPGGFTRSYRESDISNGF